MSSKKADRERGTGRGASWGILLCSALSLAGCGKLERIDSGNDPDKSVHDYNQEETRNLCKAFSDYGASLTDEVVYCGGMRLVAARIAWNRDGTPASARASCEEAEARCREDFEEAETELDCSTVSFNVACDATTRQLEDCFTLLLDTIADQYREFPACDDLTSDFLFDYFRDFTAPGQAATQAEACAPLRPDTCE